MDPAYQVLTTNELLREITKFHILQYINFPDMFIDKICTDDVYYIKWLLADNYVTFDTLDNYVKDISDVSTFMEYILFIKKSTPMILFLANNYVNMNIELSRLLKDDIFGNNVNKDFMNNFSEQDKNKIFEIVNISPPKFNYEMRDKFIEYFNECNKNILDKSKCYKEEEMGVSDKKGVSYKCAYGITLCDNPECGTILKDFNNFVNYGNQHNIRYNEDNPFKIEDPPKPKETKNNEYFDGDVLNYMPHFIINQPPINYVVSNDNDDEEYVDDFIYTPKIAIHHNADKFGVNYKEQYNKQVMSKKENNTYKMMKDDEHIEIIDAIKYTKKVNNINIPDFYNDYSSDDDTTDYQFMN